MKKRETITKLIGLDTSSSCSGYSIFINGIYSNSGILNYKNEKNSNKRLQEMCIALLSFLDKENPDIIAIEITVVTRNAEAQRTLTIILGVVYGWCITHSCEYVGLRPAEWRSLISKEKKGRKREELKKWSIYKVKELFDLECNDDQSDAILIGQALINQRINL